ncbi:hypothetical protein WUBG_12978, partial [Wuchereria bancrofti]
MEWCITYLLPSIVTKLGSSKITIRRITNQMLIAYLKLQPDALNIVQKVVGNFLLNNENDVQIKDEALREIPNLMIIELYLGTEKLRKILSELSTKQYEIWKKYEQIIFETSDTMKESVVNKEKMLSSVDVELRYRFGIIPMSTSNMLNNETDTTSRIAALEQVNVIINGITPEDTRKFAAHLHSYFLTLGNVLDDLNFKVVVLCLDVIRLTLEKVGALLAPYIQ